MTTVSRRANTTHKITVMIVKFAPRMVKCQIKKSGCDFRLKFRLLVDKKCLFAFMFTKEENQTFVFHQKIQRKG